MQSNKYNYKKVLNKTMYLFKVQAFVLSFYCGLICLVLYYETAVSGILKLVFLSKSGLIEMLYEMDLTVF